MAGAIYQNGYDLRLFDDPKASRVGDILTIRLVERTAATKKEKASTASWLKRRNRRRDRTITRISAAEATLRRRGMDTASIGVEKKNPRARTLYERQGYRVIGDDPGRWSYIDHQGIMREIAEPAWLMEKSLR